MKRDSYFFNLFWITLALFMLGMSLMCAVE